MNTFVSFLELRLEAGLLLAVLGSGRSGEVLSREISQPYMRICMRDAEVVNCRVRYGTVEQTDAGLDYSDWDEFQSRGASIRLFSWSTSLARWIGRNPEVIKELLLDRSTPWFEFNNGMVSRVGEASARQALASNQSIDDSRMFIEFHVPPAQVDEVLCLLGKNLDSASEI